MSLRLSPPSPHSWPVAGLSEASQTLHKPAILCQNSRTSECGCRCGFPIAKAAQVANSLSTQLHKWGWVWLWAPNRKSCTSRQVSLNKVAQVGVFQKAAQVGVVVGVGSGSQPQKLHKSPIFLSKKLHKFENRARPGKTRRRRRRRRSNRPEVHCGSR